MTGVDSRFICIQAGPDTLPERSSLAQNRRGVRWDAGDDDKNGDDGPDYGVGGDGYCAGDGGCGGGGDGEHVALMVVPPGYGERKGSGGGGDGGGGGGSIVKVFGMECGDENSV